MKKLMLFIFLFSVGLNCQEAANNQSVVIYNQNIGVVRDVRTLDIKKGTHLYSITDVPEKIDPTSIKIKLDAEVIEQNFKYDLASVTKVLKKYINKPIKLTGKNIISGKLLCVNETSLVVENQDKSLELISNLMDYLITVEEFPEGFVTKPTLEWKIKSDKDAQMNAEITYKTVDMNWHTEYVAMLNDDDTKIDLNAWISLENNSGMTFKNADLKLIAGEIYQAAFYNRNQVYSTVDRTPREILGTDAITFFEYYLYNIDFPTSVSNNEIKQLSLFNKNQIPCTKEYWYYSRYNGDKEETRPEILIKFENSEKNDLGLPLPKGKIGFYKKSDKTNILLGEDMIEHTPKGETLKLIIGQVFDIVIEETEEQLDTSTHDYNENEVTIEIRNRKDEDADINVFKAFYEPIEIISSNFKYTEKDGNSYTYKIHVKKNSVQKLVVKYRVKNYNN